MKIRISTILALGMAVGAGFVLFQTSQNVQQAEMRLRNIQTAMTKEKDAMRVLETEWEYLNRPDRLEELAKQYLKMEAQAPSALVGNSGELLKPPVQPETDIVAPSENIQDAVVKPDDAPEPELPMPVPSTNDVNPRNFNDLMNDLTHTEPATGGGQ